MLTPFLSPGIAGEWMSAQGFADAVRAPGVIHVSGQVGQEPDGQTPADFLSQARLAFRNVRLRVEEAGGLPVHVVSLTILIDDSVMSDRKLTNDLIAQAKREELPDAQPASTAFYVSGLVFRRFVIEVQAVAVV